MPPTAPFQSLLLRGLLLALGGGAALVRRVRARPGDSAGRTATEFGERESWLRHLRAASSAEPVTPPAPSRRAARRVGLSVGVAAIFCLGAAFTAAAGDHAAGLLEDSVEPALETTTADPAAETAIGEPAAPTETAGEEDAAPARPAPTPEPATSAPPPADDKSTTAPPAPADPAAADEDAAVIRQPAAMPESPPAPAATPAPAPEQKSTRAHGRMRPLRAPLLVHPIKLPKRPTALELENTLGGSATVWLHRVLPDPTPPSRRLTRAFARELTASARAHHVDWAVVLAVIRARGKLGSAPASKARLDAIASTLAAARAAGTPAILAAAGGTAEADTAVALAHFHRAVGLAALVHGLEWSKTRLGRRLLSNEHVAMYEGGRSDIEAGRIDVRVLALIAFLTDTYGSVTISCLESGHRLYARPGVISAHIYGLAVDISAVGDTSILGNQAPGGITEQAVRSILLLPAELRPRQVISLLGLGGPSFPQADHYNHIHVGF